MLIVYESLYWLKVAGPPMFCNPGWSFLYSKVTRRRIEEKKFFFVYVVEKTRKIWSKIKELSYILQMSFVDSMESNRPELKKFKASRHSLMSSRSLLSFDQSNLVFCLNSQDDSLSNSKV